MSLSRLAEVMERESREILVWAQDDPDLASVHDAQTRLLREGSFVQYDAALAYLAALRRLAKTRRPSPPAARSEAARMLAATELASQVKRDWKSGQSGRRA